MTCREFLEALDRGVSPDLPAMAAHSDHCASCRAAAARWLATHDALRGLGEEEPPPFLHGRIMAALRAEQARPARRAPWALRVAWAGPALVLAFVVLLAGHGLLRHSALPGSEEAPAAPALTTDLPAPPPTLESSQAPARPAPAGKGERLPTKAKEDLRARQDPGASAPAAGKALPATSQPTSTAAVAASAEGAGALAVSAGERPGSAEAEKTPTELEPREAARDEARHETAQGQAFGVRAAAAPPAETQRAPQTASVWMLRDVARGATREVSPPPHGTLPGRGPWRLDLGADGVVAVVPAGPAAAAVAPPAELAEWVASLQLTPGTYLLSPPPGG